MHDSPRLRVSGFSAEVEEHQLSLSYDLCNEGDEDLGLLDRVPKASNPALPANFAVSNAYLGLDDRILIVRKGLLPLPPGLSVAEKIVPGITRLAAGTARAERLVIPVPVHAFDPHREAHLLLSSREAVRVSCQSRRKVERVRLIVGAFPLGSALLLPLSAEFPEVFRAVPPGAPFVRYFEVGAETYTSTFELLDYEAILSPSEASG